MFARREPREREGDAIEPVLHGIATLNAAQICTVTVPTDGQLPTTGAEAQLLLPLLVGAAVLLIVGTVILARRRAVGRTTAVISGAAALLIFGIGLTPSTPAMATPTAGSGQAGCELITITNIDRPAPASATNLLPGQQAEVLAVTVHNRAAFPIELTLTTGPSTVAQAASANAYAVLLESAGNTLATGPLSSTTAAATRTLQPGSSLPVTVSAGLTAEATNTLQGQQTGFDLIITATGP